MNDRRDLELVLESGTPLIVIETTDETRVLELLREIALARSASAYRPLFRWSITDGMQRLDLDLEAQRHNAEPEEALASHSRRWQAGRLRAARFSSVLEGAGPRPAAQGHRTGTANDAKVTLLLIGHRLEMPHELVGLHGAFLDAIAGTRSDRRAIVERCAAEYRQRQRPPGQRGRGGARAADSESRPA